MSKKAIILILVPVIAAVGPAGLFRGLQWWSRVKGVVLPVASVPAGGPEATVAAAPSGGAAAPGSSEKPAASASLASAPVIPSPESGSNIVDLAEALRFDVTPAWIVTRWPCVTAGLSQLPLQGYRVPLLTGTGPEDLAGALTYYFNARHAVQRITFRGTTGDAARLIHFVAQQYRFGRRLTNDPALIRYEVPGDGGAPKSFLEVRVARPGDSFRRFDVSLVVERPGG